MHAYYQQHPDRFRAEHPNLVPRDTPVIGRAMTFLVDQSMYGLLSRIPPEGRQTAAKRRTGRPYTFFSEG